MSPARDPTRERNLNLLKHQLWHHQIQYILRSNDNKMNKKYVKQPTYLYPMKMETNFKSRMGPNLVEALLIVLRLFSPLDPARTHFAAGTLLDLDFSSFWLRFEPQKHVFGSLDSFLWGAFCCCLWMFF